MPPILHFAIEAVMFVVTILAFIAAGFIAAEIMRDEPAYIEAGDQW